MLIEEEMISCIQITFPEIDLFLIYENLIKSRLIKKLK